MFFCAFFGITYNEVVIKSKVYKVCKAGSFIFYFKTFNSLIMLDFQQKRKIRSIIYHRVTLIALFLLVLLMLHSTWNVYNKKSDSENMKNVSFKNVEELRGRSDDLRVKIDRLSTEAGIEEEIRSRFSVAKANEAMVIVVDDDTSKASTTPTGNGFWQKFLSLFK